MAPTLFPQPVRTSGVVVCTRRIEKQVNSQAWSLDRPPHGVFETGHSYSLTVPSSHPLFGSGKSKGQGPGKRHGTRAEVIESRLGAAMRHEASEAVSGLSQSSCRSRSDVELSTTYRSGGLA